MLDQLLQFRKQTETTEEDTVQIGNQYTEVRDGDILIDCAFGTVAYFPFIQHATAAVHHQGIRRQIFQILRTAAGCDL